MLQSATGMMLDATWLQELTTAAETKTATMVLQASARQIWRSSRVYVPGSDGALGHEFVGVVEECAAAPDLVGVISAAMLLI